MENENKNEKKSEHGKVFLKWQFHEMQNYKRGLLWYFVSGAVLMLLVWYAISAKNFLFGLILVLFAVLFFVLNKNAKVLDVEISEDGIAVGKKLYEYQDIENFWLFYDPPHVKSLYFHTKHSFLPEIVVSLEDANPVEVRRILSQYLREDTEKKEEPPFDTFSRIFKL